MNLKEILTILQSEPGGINNKVQGNLSVVLTKYADSNFYGHPSANTFTFLCDSNFENSKIRCLFEDYNVSYKIINYIHDFVDHEDFTTSGFLKIPGRVVVNAIFDDETVFIKNVSVTGFFYRELNNEFCLIVKNIISIDFTDQKGNNYSIKDF